MRPAPFRIKICGIRAIDRTALAAVEAGADAIGLNFYPGSVRRVSMDEAAKIASAVAGLAACVGVFVNHAAADVLQVAREVPLDWIQLHGDEPPEFAAAVGEFPVVKAFRCTLGELPQVADYGQQCAQLGVPLGAVLFDAPTRAEFGGSGTLGDWEAARQWCGEGNSAERLPLILAGGLKPENVGAAIELVRPAGVDTASGVEAGRGQKDPQRIRMFVEAARAASIEFLRAAKS